MVRYYNMFERQFERNYCGGESLCLSWMKWISRDLSLVVDNYSDDDDNESSEDDEEEDEEEESDAADGEADETEKTADGDNSTQQLNDKLHHLTSS